MGFVKHFRVVGVDIRTHISFSSHNCARENIRSWRQLRLLLRLRLDWLSFGKTSLETQCFGRHFFALSVFALHLEFVSFSKEVVNNLIQLVVGDHPPLPLIAIVSKMLPGSPLRPLLKKSLHLLFSNKWNLADNTFIFLQPLDNLDQLCLLDSFFLLVEFLEQGLNLVLFPLD